MHLRLRIILKALTLMCCMFFLTHCTRMVPDSHFNQQKLASPYTMPASAYLAMAHNQTGKDKQALELMAAGRAIYEGQWRYGMNIINQAGPMTGELADEKNVLLAKIDLIRDQPNLTIAKLASIKNVSHLSVFHQAQYHDMLAYAYQATGALVEAVVERIKLEFLLPDEQAKANNRRALWLSLTKLSRPELDTLAAESNDNSVLQGWVGLAEISRKHYRDPQDMIAALYEWQDRYPNHPAQHILPSPLEKVAAHLFASPRHMALMLPLTGPLAGPGRAIHDGFMEAYQTSGQQSHVAVKIYNTDEADIRAVYQQALNDGADYVVGPLTKSDVAVVAKMKHPVPTVLLNDADRVSDEFAFQFGLSPANEARQVAARARKAGYSNALIIAPAGAWGTDVVHAFTAQWTTNGGKVAETWQYPSNTDLSLGIRQLLHASESAARIRPTKPVPLSSSNADKRRHDFDVIILIAYPSKARQIMPLLRYYFAGDVPVFGTSSVYSGIENTGKDRDLNGLIFSDMPWVFSHRQLGQQHQWSEQLNSYNRLYALGMDSFTLANQLNHLMLFPAVGINDKSGVIYLTKDHKLTRILMFGQFRQGAAHLLDAEQDKSML
ncbi:MAG: penicillin-binding protein activator [Legionella sp.]|nr:MAG: penicillin-binding protein activator [Legionella sp.]